MGGASSTSVPSSTIVANSSGLGPEALQQIVTFMLPIYHLKGELPINEKDKIVLSWKMIINNQLPEFNRLKKENLTNCTGAVEFFADKFYSRFVEIHPSSQSMFTKGSVKQGKLFMTMITLIVKTIEDDEHEKFTRMLGSLAKSHNPMGIRAAECKQISPSRFYID